MSTSPESGPTANDTHRMRRWLPLALAVLLAITLLPGIAAVDALETREARDTAVALESTTRREWVIPTYGHEAWFEKPVGGYVPEMAALRLLPRLAGAPTDGLTDVATSRLVRALLAAALALLIATIGERCFGARAGWLAACALASSVALPLCARADGTQLTATLCAWLAIGGFLALAKGSSRRPGLTRVIAWTGIGAAALVGGPLPALWPLGGFALYFALARTRDAWRAIDPAAGVWFVLGMMLPWYGAMAALHEHAFLSHVAWFPYAAEVRRAWFTGPLLAFSFTLVLAFPWTPVLGAALRDATARLSQRRESVANDLRDDDHVASLLLSLLLVGAVPVALYPGPPLTAAMPAMPAIALLCGRFLDRVLAGEDDPALLTNAARLAALLGTAAALLAVTLASRIAEAAAPLRVLGVVLLLASWAPTLADLLGRRRIAAALFALPVALGTPWLSARVLPPLEPWLNARPVAEAMLSVAPPDAPLALLESVPASLRAMLPHDFVVLGGAPHALETLVARDGCAYVAFPPAREHEALRLSPVPLEILRRTPVLVLARARLSAPAAPRDTAAAR